MTKKEYHKRWRLLNKDKIKKYRASDNLRKKILRKKYFNTHVSPVAEKKKIICLSLSAKHVAMLNRINTNKTHGQMIRVLISDTYNKLYSEGKVKSIYQPDIHTSPQSESLPHPLPDTQQG